MAAIITPETQYYAKQIIGNPLSKQERIQHCRPQGTRLNMEAVLEVITRKKGRHESGERAGATYMADAATCSG